MNSTHSVLVLGAHPDDVELMCGGTIAKWIAGGCRVHVLTFTDGRWVGADGTQQRSSEQAIEEELAAARVIGYTVENLREPTMELNYEDRLVVEVLKRLHDHDVDTILCPWEDDLHHDHEIVARVGVAASKRVPRVLHGQIASHLRTIFVPNIFVDITDSWQKKIEALKCYRSEWERTDGQWEAAQEQITGYYGQLAGVARAEGFMVRKFLID